MIRIKNIFDDVYFNPKIMKYITNWGIARFLTNKSSFEEVNKVVADKITCTHDCVTYYYNGKCHDWYFSQFEITFLFEDNSIKVFNSDDYNNRVEYCNAIYNFLTDYIKNDYNLPGEIDLTTSINELIL